MTSRLCMQVVGTAPPVQLFLELTSACNLRCRHCYVRAGEGKTRSLAPMEVQHMLGEFKEMGGEFVSFSGGEPILYKDLRPVMRYARFLGLETMLLSNGTALRADILDFLCEIESHVAISLDGASEVIHDGLRGSGAFVRTMGLLRQLSDKSMGQRGTLCFTPSATNCADLPSIVRIADQLGIGTVYISLLERRGRADACIDNLSLNPEQVRCLLFSILSLQERYPRVMLECLNLKYFTERLRGLPIEGDGLDRTVRVTPDGDVYLTAYLDDAPFHLGRYAIGTLQSLWYSAKTTAAFQTTEARPRTVTKCQTCFALQWCRAGSAAFAWAASGTFDAVDCFCEAKQAVVRELVGGRR